MAPPDPRVVHMLDYGAGNVRSIRNAIEAVGWRIVDVVRPEQLADAGVLVFPGVGAFGSAMAFLNERGFVEPLRAYLAAGRPYFGICLGMQTLFESSEESPGVAGLGVIPGAVRRFPPGAAYSVPHIGWNGVRLHQASPALAHLAAGAAPDGSDDGKVYFVHSYRAAPSAANAGWVAATTDYGDGPFISAVQRGLVFATQFHPEKSGPGGLAVFARFLAHATGGGAATEAAAAPVNPRLQEQQEGGNGAAVAVAAAPRPLEPVPVPGGPPPRCRTRLARRIVACLDVRENDEGDLVVTKGDQYDVREKGGEGGSDGGAAGARRVRNLGKPVELVARYYAEGADEVALLNITAFRGEPLDDAPLLAVLEAASARVFVPLTIGGGIRGYTDSAGRPWSALDVAARYFRAGADKVSIGSDAVAAAEAFIARGRVADGSTAIEQIAGVYGRQAVVVSIDPRRVYVADPSDPAVAGLHVIPTAKPGPAGERHVWYQCLVKGGREGRPLDAWALARAVEALGAGELLVNCVDCDGQKGGFDEELLADICGGVSIPVIASSGAGAPAHFTSVFAHTRVEAALAAGIFHRHEVAISEVKAHMAAAGVEARR